MNWADKAQGIANIAQTAAIAVGGAWAYMRYVRGRTYHRRLELQIGSEMVTVSDRHLLRVHLAISNTGAATLPLAARRVTIACATRDLWHDAQTIGGAAVVLWRDIGWAPILDAHARIEAQETITEDTVVPVPLPPEQLVDIGAYRVSVSVSATPRRWRRSTTTWDAQTVVLITATRLEE